MCLNLKGSYSTTINIKINGCVNYDLSCHCHYNRIPMILPRALRRLFTLFINTSPTLGHFTNTRLTDTMNNPIQSNYLRIIQRIVVSWKSNPRHAEQCNAARRPNSPLSHTYSHKSRSRIKCVSYYLLCV